MGEDTWWFSEAEAADAAREVVHHDPDTPWDRMPAPVDAAAASASLTALAAEFQKLPPSIRGALGRASGNAAQLSDDRLQGLAELLQNADDEGADSAYFLVDNDRLLLGHNGNDFTLPDVWGLTIPWLSEKTSKAEKLGRFGIGLKTLQSLSETLEGHNGHFHIRLGRSTLKPAEHDDRWPNKPASATTVFVVPFQHGATTQDEVARWLQSWGDAGLIFLRTLQEVTLLDPDGQAVARLAIDRTDAETLNFEGGEATRMTVTAEDRSWVLYTRNAKSPVGHRAGKSHHDTTPVSVAFARFVGDEGHAHVGLPVRSVGLPFRFAGQFDPLANRRDLADSQWNLHLVELVADLWRDAILDQFRLDASNAWASVPLDEEYASNAMATGQLNDAFSESLMTRARLALAERLRLVGDEGSAHPLRDLAFETPALTNILTDNDIRGLAGAADVVVVANRSHDGRWRDVIAELDNLGAETPVVVDVASAVQLLNADDRTVEFIADLTAAVVEVATRDEEEDEDLEVELIDSSCLVLDDGRRVSPADASDLGVLLPEDAAPLWSTLGFGAHLHPDYTARPGWPGVAEWLLNNDTLRRTATNDDALRVLAAAGRMGIELPDPLSDDQANALRAALESVDESLRPGLGVGIGRAIRLEATVYGTDGKPKRIHARPADSYLIEREKGTWSNAAKRTPDLVWLHRRYLKDLRTPAGRAGLGPQKLFRLLGAENVPRLQEFPDDDLHYKQFVYYGRGLLRDAPGSPARRKRQMDEVGAQCTRNDHAAPDLDKVLASIAAERNGALRRQRATALLGCLARNWDRLEPYAKVSAVVPYNGWIDKGEVDAWWISQAASVPWLGNGRGRQAAPGELRLKTQANEALHGSDPAQYLADAYDDAASRDVLAALGVAGNPTVAALIAQLIAIREAHLSGQSLTPDTTGDRPLAVTEAADLAAPLYQALAAEVRGTGARRTIGNRQASGVRADFDRGHGLIITSHGWRRISATRSGPPIFGDLAAFVPAVAGAEPLWAALGVQPPDADDAKRVIKKLAGRRVMDADERQIMLEALRILARTPAESVGRLRRQPVYVGTGWMSNRPVYAVENPLLAEALKTKVPIWQPGGPLTQLKPLIEPLALTSIDGTQARVLGEGSATYDLDLTETFRRAVRNLQTDLTVSAPRTAETISVTWEELAEFQVAVLPELRVHVAIPDSAGHQVPVPSWLDVSRGTLLVESPEAAHRPRCAGYALASLFGSSPREIDQAWVVAWADAEIGAQAELVVSAAERAAEEKLRREKSQAALISLPSSNEAGPRKTSRKQRNGAKAVNGTSAPHQTPQPARTLVDTEALVLRTAGNLILGRPRGDESANAAGATGSSSGGKSKLTEPKYDQPKQARTGGRGPLNYTAQERESAGLDLLRMVLDSDGLALTDVRHQPNVGADAVDDRGRYYELKVHQGPIPDTVKLENSQIERAMAVTDDYFLVLVGNVEAGQGNPEVRIIHDPLHHLKVQPQGAVHLTGVLTAEVARSWTFEPSADPGDEEPSDSE
ncbi:hypothetical protein KUV85_00390 [Nocardioides panacisoli]|uniref:sacsin N-terminal ATP-binding-like domain-containing protein n=1 Tax=Nocardioides panacisoli TaxID=627624 RepID=UPI001C628144|nr:hypothetical protein [Nocardioides panacisoli]QYJ04173.1 hypothetical protein KUV85_00390 [Nocardioides panacisoli]